MCRKLLPTCNNIGVKGPKMPEGSSIDLLDVPGTALAIRQSLLAARIWAGLHELLVTIGVRETKVEY